ncbi:MAG: MFS transporter [Nocardioidaceae bacterium]
MSSNADARAGTTELDDLNSQGAGGQNLSTPRVVLAISALALGGFAIGTTEFVTMGLLPQIAAGVGVSIPTAGHIITAYALGVVVGAPVIAALGAKMPRKGMLVMLMIVFAVCNAGAAMAQGFGSLTLMRFLSGVPHGAFFGIAALVAASLVSPAHRGRAVAAVMMGLSVANVIGVPLATWMGQQLGWRSAYWLVAGIALATVASVLRLVPHKPPCGTATIRGELSALKKPQVVMALLVGTIGFGGMFAMYSYIAPLVTEVGGMSEASVPVYLALYGLGGVAGAIIGGRMADHAVLKAMAGSLVAMGLLLGLLTVSITQPVLAGATIVCIAFSGSALVIALQVRLMDVAGQAQTLGAALNHSSLNLANALGAWLGGLVIAHGLGYRATSWVGVVLAGLGLLVVAVSAVTSRRWPTGASAALPQPITDK